jgi:hypothetical protein
MGKMSASHGIVMALVCAAATSIATDRAGAAVRLCETEVAGEATKQDEVQSRTEALENWRSAVEQRFGAGYVRWELAAPHVLSCAREPGGMHCVARGRPCTVRQVPQPDWVPLRHAKEREI